jgi:hypothetical protein
VIVTLLTIVFLIGMWVAVLAAPVLQNRGASAARGGDSIKTFQRQLATLERTSPSPRGLPADRVGGLRHRGAPGGRAKVLAGPAKRPLSSGQRAAQRRRRVLGWLVATAGVSLALAFVFGRLFLLVHLLVDALLIAYVALMVRTMRIHAEQEMKVAFLPHRSSGAEPTALLQEARSRRA